MRFPHSFKLTTSKRSNSARLPQGLNVAASKAKQFCETSSSFEHGNVKNKRFLRDFLQTWKVECRADSRVPMRFAICPVYVCKVLRLPRKSDARSYEVLHLSRKIILANLQIWCSKMQPLSRNQRPSLLTSLMNMSLVLRLPRVMHLCRSSANLPRLPSFLDMLQNPHVLLTVGKVQNPLRLPRKTTSEPSKWWFCNFDFEMCFVPQRHALFRHLNFQKWTSQLPKVVWTWCVLSFNLFLLLIFSPLLYFYYVFLCSSAFLNLFLCLLIFPFFYNDFSSFLNMFFISLFQAKFSYFRQNILVSGNSFLFQAKFSYIRQNFRILGKFSSFILNFLFPGKIFLCQAKCSYFRAKYLISGKNTLTSTLGLYLRML